MADTTVPVVVANAVSTVTTGVGVVIFGVHTGLDYPTLLAGVLGGATALSYLEKAGLLHRAFEITSAALLAGYSSPVLAEISVHMFNKFDLVKEGNQMYMAVKLILAFPTGYLAHGVILPGLRKISLARIKRAANE